MAMEKFSTEMEEEFLEDRWKTVTLMERENFGFTMTISTSKAASKMELAQDTESSTL